MSASRIRAERAWVVWGAAYVIAAVVLCSTDHQSRSGDSRYYSAQATRMVSAPAPEWIAPRWGENHYERQPREYFREHPTGHFILGATVARLGVPSRHALHLVNMLCQIAGVVLLMSLAARFAPREHALAYLWAVQLTSISFSHVIRANHEQTMFLCIVLVVYGAVRMADNLRWSLLVVLGLNALFLIKGLIVVIGPVLATWAFLCCAARDHRQRVQPGLALIAIATLTVGVTAGLYEWVYRSATDGVSFFSEYWTIQIQARSVEFDGRVAYGRLFSLQYYVTRHLTYTLPWIAFAVLLSLGARVSGRSGPAPDAGVRRVDWIFLGCTVAYIAVFSTSARYASRYVYPSYFLFALPIIIEAFRRSTRLARLQRWINGFGAHRFAALLWLAIFCGQIAEAQWRDS